MRYCIGNEEDTEDLYAAHGTVVASIVGGKTYGVAKNDNIHDCCGWFQRKSCSCSWIYQGESELRSY